MRSKNTYAIVYPDRVRSVRSDLPVDVLCALIQQGLDLMTSLEIPVPEIEVWMQRDRWWHPVLARTQRAPMLDLRTIKGTDLQQADLHYLELGGQVIRLYQSWLVQKRQLEATCRMRFLSSENYLGHMHKTRYEEVVQKLACIDEIAEAYCDPNLIPVFTYLVKDGLTATKIADLLHYSQATVHRYWRQVKRQMGYGIETRFSPEQVAALLNKTPDAKRGSTKESEMGQSVYADAPIS